MLVDIVTVGLGYALKTNGLSSMNYCHRVLFIRLWVGSWKPLQVSCTQPDKTNSRAIFHLSEGGQGRYFTDQKIIMEKFIWNFTIEPNATMNYHDNQ